MSTVKHTPAPVELETVAQETSRPVGTREKTAGPAVWKGYQKVLFRIAFVFFVLMSIPNTKEWYKTVFSIDWTSLHYRDLYDIARFSPSFLPNNAGAFSLNGYGDWVAALVIATVGGLIWSLLDRKRKEYNQLYYWLRVIVRYRAGIGIIGFGFTKLLPVQMPYPSIGLLNTNFGDLTAQKIYWLSIGIVPWYQVFAGVVEITAGAFLFFRKTTTLGAALLFGALGDIVYVNFAYDGGVHVYSSYFVLYAAFLMLYDIPKLYDLLILEKYTVPRPVYPSFSQAWLRYTRVALKTATIGIFLVLLFYVQYINFRYDPYKQPAQRGLTQLRGYYNVTQFKLNDQEIPYSPLDSLRWQNVTFERWSSLTFNVNRPVQLDLSNGGGSPMRDINRTFELTGVAGGRRVFYYDADTVHQVLYLQDKNVTAQRRNRREVQAQAGPAGNAAERPAFERPDGKKGRKDDWIPKEAQAIIGSEDPKIAEIARSTRRTRGIASEKAQDPPRNHMVLHYTTEDGGARVVLQGVDEKKRSVYIVLDRVNKAYALSEGKLDAGSY